MNKMSKYTKQVRLILDAGLSYYDFGTIKQGRKKLYDYYKTDKITHDQKEFLESKGAIIKLSYCQYAPEIKSTLICFN
jgi:hypothetical protein